MLSSSIIEWPGLGEAYLAVRIFSRSQDQEIMASWMNSNSELDLGLIGAAGGVRGADSIGLAEDYVARKFSRWMTRGRKGNDG